MAEDLIKPNSGIATLATESPDPRTILHFKTLAKFNEKLGSGRIDPNKHFCVISDAKMFWVRGVFIADNLKLDGINEVYNDWEITQNNANTITITLKCIEWDSSTRKWINKTHPLTINAATQSIAGLQSAADKLKEDRITRTNHTISNTSTANDRTIKLTAINPTDNSDASTTTTIPSATQLDAGLLNTVDKKAVDNLHAGSWSHIDDSNTFTATTTDVNLNYTCRQSTQESNSASSTHSQPIGAVSSSRAGVMIAQDKIELDRINTANFELTGITPTTTTVTINTNRLNINNNTSGNTDKTIPAATQGAAGVLTATDKKAIDNLHAQSWSHINHDNTFTATANDVNMNYVCRSTTNDSTGGSEVHASAIGAVSSTRAGVMIAQDKIELDRVNTTNFGLTGITPNADTVTINTTRLNINTNASGNTDQTIPAATSSKAGVMTSTDKTEFDRVSTANFALGAVTPNANTVAIAATKTNVTTGATETNNITIPESTATTAGVASALDKKKLNSITYVDASDAHTAGISKIDFAAASTDTISISSETGASDRGRLIFNLTDNFGAENYSAAPNGSSDYVLFKGTNGSTDTVRVAIGKDLESINPSSGNLERVLNVTDMNTEVTNRNNAITSAIQALDSSISAEPNKYISAVTITDGKISGHSKEFVSGAALTNYTKGSSNTSVTSTDTVNSAMSKLENQVDTERTRATNAESTLTANLSAEVTRATNRENAIESALNSYKTSNDKALADEISRATGAENTLQNNINATNNRVSSLETKVGNESVATQITNAINALDATVGSTTVASGKHVAVQVTEADGKLTGVTVTESDIASASTLSGHMSNTSNPHSVTKAQVGLGNVDNTSDANKPVSTAMQTALNNKVDKTTTVNGHALSSNVTVSKSDVGLGNVTNDAQVKRSEMGVASGVATLGTDGKVPSAQLPSYVDDVLEYANKASFPATGESGKIYTDLATNLIYRWSGSSYVEISQSLALGETSSTAYAGDKGKAVTDAFNTHKADTTIHITAAERTAWNAKTSNTGTVTGVKINGTTYNPTNGIVDLGTVSTDLSGYVPKTGTVWGQTFDSNGNISGNLSLSRSNLSMYGGIFKTVPEGSYYENYLSLDLGEGFLVNNSIVIGENQNDHISIEPFNHYIEFKDNSGDAKIQLSDYDLHITSSDYVYLNDASVSSDGDIKCLSIEVNRLYSIAQDGTSKFGNTSITGTLATNGVISAYNGLKVFSPTSPTISVAVNTSSIQFQNNTITGTLSMATASSTLQWNNSPLATQSWVNTRIADIAGGGNVTATLEPHTLWGQTFDGTGDVDGNMSVNGGIGTTGNVFVGGAVGSSAYKLRVNGTTCLDGNTDINGNINTVAAITGTGAFRTTGYISVANAVNFDDAYGFINVARHSDAGNATCFSWVRAGQMAFGLGYNSSNQIIIGQAATNKTTTPWLTIKNGGVISSSFQVSGGSSTQFLKADGSLDSSAYVKQVKINGATYSPSATGLVDLGTITGGTSSSGSLATHTIWGQPFNGTQDVSGELTGVTNITASGTVNAAKISGQSLDIVSGDNSLKAESTGIKLQALTNKGTVVSAECTLSPAVVGGLNINGEKAATENWVQQQLSSSDILKTTNTVAAKFKNTSGSEIRTITIDGRSIDFEGENGGRVLAPAVLALGSLGNILLNGVSILTASSDERLKSVISNVDLDLDTIANAPSVLFKWNSNGQRSIGSIAQYWNAITPELIEVDTQGYLHMDYGKIALISAINVARKTVDHETKIKQLEERVKELEQMLEK